MKHGVVCYIILYYAKQGSMYTYITYVHTYIQDNKTKHTTYITIKEIKLHRYALQL